MTILFLVGVHLVFGAWVGWHTAMISHPAIRWIAYFVVSILLLLCASGFFYILALIARDIPYDVYASPIEASADATLLSYVGLVIGAIASRITHRDSTNHKHA